MIRQLFHRNQEFVAVKTFRFDAATLLHPGDPLPDGTRTFHKQSLFRRRLIGAKDDPWTLAQIPKPVPVVAPPDDDDDLDIDLSTLEDDSDVESDLKLDIPSEDDSDADGEKPDAEGESEVE